MTEISVENKTCFFICFYRSPSQSHDEFKNFCSELNLLLTNINNNQLACSILIGDFNAKCSKSCSSEKNNRAGLEIGNSQLINKPIHFINGTSSRIDLIFFFQRDFFKKLWNRTIHL